MKSKVEPNKTRYPSTKYAGNFFSESMPVGPREVGKTPTSPSSTPQGLSSINRVSGSYWGDRTQQPKIDTSRGGCPWAILFEFLQVEL